MIYVKEGIYYKRRDDLEIRGIECIWIEVANHNKHILFALFYRPPNSNMSYLNDIEDSIALAVDTGISEIKITGDLNLNILSSPTRLRINIVRKLKFKLDRKSLETIYTTFIRPLLEYGDIIWDNCTQAEKDELDKIQNKVARIATGATKLVSINNLYKEICWESLQNDAMTINWLYSLKCIIT